MAAAGYAARLRFWYISFATLRSSAFRLALFALARSLSVNIAFALAAALAASMRVCALPALIEKMEDAGCPKSVVGLVVPAGYSFNLDGTNIYLTMAALFVAQALNIDLSLRQQLTVLGVAMLTGGWSAVAPTRGATTWHEPAATARPIAGPSRMPFLPAPVAM